MVILIEIICIYCRFKFYKKKENINYNAYLYITTLTLGYIVDML